MRALKSAMTYSVVNFESFSINFFVQFYVSWGSLKSAYIWYLGGSLKYFWGSLKSALLEINGKNKRSYFSSIKPI